MQDRDRGLTRRGFIKAAAILSLAPLVVGFPSESTPQTPEKKLLSDNELTELLLTTNNSTNSFERREAIAKNMGNTQNIAELVNRDGLNRFFLGVGSEQNGSYLNEIVVKINRIPDGSRTSPEANNISTESARVNYEVTLGPSLAPPIWAELLYGETQPNGGYTNSRIVSRETLLNILENIKQDSKCGLILGANFGSESTFGLTCVSEQIDPHSIETYDHMLGLLSAPNFTQTSVTRPYRGSDHVLIGGVVRESLPSQVEIQNVPVLIDGRLPRMAPFSSFKAVHEIDTRPQYIANSTRVGLETHDFEQQFMQLTLDHGYASVVDSPHGIYIDASKPVPCGAYSVFDYDLTRAAVSAFNSPARLSGVLA